jgi:hypothetical protein
MLRGRLNNKDMMTQKNFFVEFNDCIIFDDYPRETTMHLFFECSFSQGFWCEIGMEWNTGMSIYDIISEAKNRYSINFSAGVSEIRVMMLFSMETCQISKDVFLNLDFFLNMHRAKPSLKKGMKSWLDTV